MRIRRVRVPDFGPLRDVELELDPTLNVVYGPNEAGKTTLLDFLLSHLFRWERRSGTRLETVIGDLDRFGDAGESGGRIELRMGSESHEYPGGPSLLHHLGLEHAGLAGLFCVRSGELELPEKEKGEFWTELKKVLSGLPSGVDALREKVHLAARLTPTGEPSDRGSPGPKTRHAELRNRIERLEELEERLPEAARCEEEIARLERRQEALERARRARVIRLTAELDRVRERLEELQEVPDERVEKWRRKRDDRERLEERRRGEEERLKEWKEDAARREEELTEAREAASELGARLAAAEERELADRAREAAGEEARPAGPSPPALRGGAVASFVAALAAVAAGAAGTLDPLPAAVAGAAAAALGGWLLHRSRAQASLRATEESRRRGLLDVATEAGLEVSSVEEIPRALSRLRQRAAEEESDLRVARERASHAGERVQELEDEIESLEKREASLEDEMASLRQELGFDELSAAEEAREERAEAEARARALRSTLEDLAGTDESAWRQFDPPDGSGLPAWDAAEKSRVDDRLEEQRERYRSLRDEFVAAGLSAPEDVLVELRGCREELREIETDWEAGRLAGRIFADMGESLDRRLDRALSREGEFAVGALTRRFTARYREVRRREDGSVQVLDGNRDAWLHLEALSRGARDQVYLAIRIGMARAALEAAGGEEGGFLLLDDAFLTADWTRRERLVETSADLADAGWQVVYLTCDDHLRDLFLEAGARLQEL